MALTSLTSLNSLTSSFAKVEYLYIIMFARDCYITSGTVVSLASSQRCSRS